MQSPNLVIFDCDGTLVDSLIAIHDAMSAAFCDFGLEPPPLPALRKLIGLSIPEQVARLAPDMPPARYPALEEAYRVHRLGARNPREPLFPGARACLEHLDRVGILLAVATAKSTKGLDLTLDLHGLRSFFVSLQTGDRNPGKPHPGMIENALRETGADAARTILVGDTRFDVEMAVNAGVIPVGVAWGYHPSEALAEAGATHVAQNFAGLTVHLLHRLAPC